MTDLNKLIWTIISLVVLWIIYQLTPILMPFYMAALLAYIGDPIADKLETWHLSRTLSTVIIFFVVTVVIFLILLVIVPLLLEQVKVLINAIPDYIAAFQNTIIPWLEERGFPVDVFDWTRIKHELVTSWEKVGKVTGSVFSQVTQSGVVALQFITNLVLIPVIAFYLLRDWDIFIANFRTLLPRRYVQEVTDISVECDEMLGAFLQGQLMVMLGLTIMYIVGLSFIGLELALLIGVVAGLVSFIPYLGLIVGIGFAGFAAYFQFHELLPIVMVVGVFSLAQTVEGMYLTPRFVGKRIGLNPVAVLFAVMAGAQLFGFMGILLALPVATVVMVLLRHGYKRYIASSFYS